MSAHASGVFGVGVEPPPDSSDPSLQVAIRLGSPVTAPRSAWVICPIFSSRVIRASSSSARARGGSEASIHGRAAAALATGAATRVVSRARQMPTAPTRQGRRIPRMVRSFLSAPGPEPGGPRGAYTAPGEVPGVGSA
jgi:hypothetical protein